METFKEVVLPITFVLVVVFGGLIFALNKSEQQDFERQVKCKEIGGAYVYENSSWICK